VSPPAASVGWERGGGPVAGRGLSGRPGEGAPRLAVRGPRSIPASSLAMAIGWIIPRSTPAIRLGSRSCCSTGIAAVTSRASRLPSTRGGARAVRRVPLGCAGNICRSPQQRKPSFAVLSAARSTKSRCLAEFDEPVTQHLLDLGTTCCWNSAESSGPIWTSIPNPIRGEAQRTLVGLAQVVERHDHHGASNAKASRTECVLRDPSGGSIHMTCNRRRAQPHPRRDSEEALPYRVNHILAGCLTSNGCSPYRPLPNGRNGRV
jgi:hypothetical protein